MRFSWQDTRAATARARERIRLRALGLRKQDVDAAIRARDWSKPAAPATDDGDAGGDGRRDAGGGGGDRPWLVRPPTGTGGAGASRPGSAISRRTSGGSGATLGTLQGEGVGAVAAGRRHARSPLPSNPGAALRGRLSSSSAAAAGHGDNHRARTESMGSYSSSSSSTSVKVEGHIETPTDFAVASPAPRSPVRRWGGSSISPRAAAGPVG